MKKEAIKRIAKICVGLDFGEEFYFTICEKGNKEVKYNIGAKLIEEFSSILLLVGSCGGGSNMVFLANDNMDNRDTLLEQWIIEEFSDEFQDYVFDGIEIDYMPKIAEFKKNPMVLKTINCDGNIETREYNSVYDFINHVNSGDEKFAFSAPMLDDKIDTIIIDEMTIALANFKTLNDFYKEVE